MKNFPFLLVLLCLCSLTAFAQTPKPSPPNKDDGDVVKITTALIQVDVTVTDKNGKIVTDLKPEDFEVYENKEKQTITNFSFISAAPVTELKAAGKAEKGKISVPVPPVAIRPEQVRRTIALVVDDLGLSAKSIFYVRRSLKKFVDEQMQPNDLVAVIRTGGGIGATQQFTSDKQQLYAAIENVHWNSAGRADVDPFAPPEILPTEEAKLAGLKTTGGSNDAAIAEERQRLQGADSYREDIFATGTLGAVNFIIKGMGDLPGRKSIMFFSDGFKTSPTENPGVEPPPNKAARDAGATAKLLAALKRMTDLANRSSVIIYSFDARGLVTLDPSEYFYKLQSNLIHNNREGLTFLAKETGGKTFFNMNDMNLGLDEALEDQKGFYLLGYQPDAESFDPKENRFNTFEIKVNRPGVKVRYRSGFFGRADKDETTAIAPPATQNPSAQQLLKAISSPFAASDINLRLNTVFGSNEQDGSFVQSFLHIDASKLQFTDEPDGWKKAVFDVLAMSFGENGVPVSQLSKVYTLRLKGDTYTRIAKEGFVYNFLFPIKAGAYQMRVAIRDTATAKIGSASQFIQVPDLKENRLTLSGIVLENFNEAQWKKTQADSQTDPTVDATVDTSLRRFKKGTILRYGVDIYNAKALAAKPDLQTQIRIFRDGKVILEGTPNPINIAQTTVTNGINYVGALILGEEMAAGDYVLQIIVKDKTAKESQSIATQWVQFEMVE